MRCNKQKLQVGHVEAFSLRFFACASFVTYEHTSQRWRRRQRRQRQRHCHLGLLLRCNGSCDTLSHTHTQTQAQAIARKANTQGKWNSNTDNYLNSYGHTHTHASAYACVCVCVCECLYVCVMLFARLLLFNYNKLYFNCDREGHKPNRTTFVFVVFAVFLQAHFIVFCCCALCKHVTKCFYGCSSLALAISRWDGTRRGNRLRYVMHNEATHAIFLRVPFVTAQ